MENNVLQGGQTAIPLDKNTHNLLRQANGMIAILRGREGVYEFVNDNYSKFFGHRLLIGKSLREAFPELD